MKIKGGKDTTFQIDTGATCNVLKKSELTGTKYERRIKPTAQVLRMYNNSAINPMGKCKIQLQDPTTKKKYKVHFTIIKDEDAKHNLLGCSTVQSLGLIYAKSTEKSTQHVERVSQVTKDNAPSQVGVTLHDIKTSYKDVFEGLGLLGPELHLEIDERAKPVQLPPRKVPESLKQPLKSHLDELVALGVIEMVEVPTEWVSSIVVAPKPNGKIRLCLDPRPLNQALKRCHHPLPNIEDILPELADAKVFTKVDCKNGYWQVPLDEQSSLLTTFNTPWGRYKWKRMPFGISPAGEIFQQRLDQAIAGLDGVRTVADDILITGNGATIEDAITDHDRKLEMLLDRCRSRHIKLNSEKIVLKKTSMPYIGHILTSDGVQADPSKIQAILSMNPPTDVAGVRRILGTVNYLAKFLPRLSQISEPLRQLTKKENPFIWDNTHDEAFTTIKNLITKPPVLKYYDPASPLVLQCDASDHGLGAALLQNDKPVAFASRALTDAERNYAQIEKELLAIVYGTERFHQYTYGRSVIVESDHKPLETLSRKPLSTAPRRLQKMMMVLQNYDVTIKYKKGTEMYVADTLSRHHLESTNNVETTEPPMFTAEELAEVARLEEINQLLTDEATLKQFQAETLKDKDLQLVKQYIQQGWREKKGELNPAITAFFHIRDELVTQDGLIFRGDRLIIPKSLRRQMLIELHSAHQGLESIMRRARESIYWPHLNQELRDHIARCQACSTYRDKQSKEPLIPHEIPDRAWAKLGCDLFEFDNRNYLITVDYFSTFFEIDRLEHATAKYVIKKLKAHFARYGIPEVLVSDNGTQFTSQDFNEFTATYGFEHVRSSPHHHQSNGKAEAAVKQAKKMMRRCKDSGDDPFLALLTLRNTPQQHHETSPAQRLLNRRTRTRLPTQAKLMKPKINKNTAQCIKKAQEIQQKYYNRGSKELDPLKNGDIVRLQPIKLGEKKWKIGRIVRKVGIRSYEVECQGYKYVRNRRFLRKVAITETDEEDGDDELNTNPPEKDLSEETVTPTNANREQPPQVSDQPTNEGIPRTPQPSTKTRSGRTVKEPARFGFES